MLNKFVKYILVLTCWCSIGIAAYGQTDTTQNSIAADSSVQSSGTDTSTGSNSDTDNVSELDKFSKKDTIVFAERYLPAASVKKLNSDEELRYSGKEAEKKKDDSPGFWETLLSSPTFHLIFWMIVIGAFVAIIVMYLMSNKVWLFSSKSKKLYGEEKPPEETAGNIFTMNFDEQVAKALDAGNYRVATRLLFLRLLRSMSERNIIQYGVDKTNMDYLFELNNTKYFKAFAQVSRNYEYVWYGNFDIKQDQFMHIRTGLDQFNQQINN